MYIHMYTHMCIHTKAPSQRGGPVAQHRPGSPISISTSDRHVYPRRKMACRRLSSAQSPWKSAISSAIQSLFATCLSSPRE